MEVEKAKKAGEILNEVRRNLTNKMAIITAIVHVYVEKKSMHYANFPMFGPLEKVQAAPRHHSIYCHR